MSKEEETEIHDFAEPVKALTDSISNNPHFPKSLNQFLKKLLKSIEANITFSDIIKACLGNSEIKFIKFDECDSIIDAFADQVLLNLYQHLNKSLQNLDLSTLNAEHDLSNEVMSKLICPLVLTLLRKTQLEITSQSLINELLNYVHNTDNHIENLNFLFRKILPRNLAMAFKTLQEQENVDIKPEFALHIKKHFFKTASIGALAGIENNHPTLITLADKMSNFLNQIMQNIAIADAKAEYSETPLNTHELTDIGSQSLFWLAYLNLSKKEQGKLREYVLSLTQNDEQQASQLLLLNYDQEQLNEIVTNQWCNIRFITVNFESLPSYHLFQFAEKYYANQTKIAYAIFCLILPTSSIETITLAALTDWPAWVYMPIFLGLLISTALFLGALIEVSYRFAINCWFDDLNKGPNQKDVESFIKDLTHAIHEPNKKTIEEKQNITKQIPGIARQLLNDILCCGRSSKEINAADEMVELEMHL